MPDRVKGFNDTREMLNELLVVGLVVSFSITTPPLRWAARLQRKMKLEENPN